MTAFSFVRVTFKPSGAQRVYSLVEYCLLPSAALLCTNAEFLTRCEALGARAVVDLLNLMAWWCASPATCVDVLRRAAAR